MPTWNEVIEEIKETQETRPSAFDEVRWKYLQDLSEYTGRDAILYSSGWNELDVQSRHLQITDTDVHGFMQTIHDFSTTELDLIVHSPGGSPENAEQIVTYLRSKFNDIRIIVPQSALSAASLMCCAADEVVLANHSALGPTDPQMIIPTETGQRMVPAQAIVDQFEEVEDKANDGEEIAHFAPILHQYDPGLLNEAREAVDLSKELAEDWAERFMFSGQKNASTKANKLAKYLSDRQNFLSHYRRIGRARLLDETDMKIKKLEADDDLQDLVLSVFHATVAAHSHNNVIKIIENNYGSNYSRKVRSS